MGQSMLYSLIRRDPFWRMMPLATIFVAILAAWHKTAAVWTTYASLGIFVCVRGCFHSSRFLSGLPVAGRSIFLARFASAMAMAWFPAVVATAILFGSRGSDGSVQGLELLNVASGFIVVFLLAYSIRITMFYTHEWMMGMALLPGFLALGMGKLPVVPTAAAALFLIVMLFIRVWKTVPESFQIVSRKAPRASCEGIIQHYFPALVLPHWPYIRFVILSGYVVLALPVLFFYSSLGRWLGVFVFILADWGIFHERVKWLRTLPIAPRMLLLAFVLPIVAVILAGYYAEVWFSIPPFRGQVVSVAALTGLTLVELIFCEALSRRKALHMLVMLLPIAWWWGFLHGGPITRADVIGPLMHISAKFSDGLLLAIAIAGLTLLYLALNKIFNESEFAKISPLRRPR